MEDAFDRQSSFNGDISSWDVNSVTNMAGMFIDPDSLTACTRSETSRPAPGSMRVGP